MSLSCSSCTEATVSKEKLFGLPLIMLGAPDDGELENVSGTFVGGYGLQAASPNRQCQVPIMKPMTGFGGYFEARKGRHITSKYGMKLSTLSRRLK